jgi:hypothetical protein
MKKVKKITALLSTLTLLVLSNANLVYAVDEPAAPEAPESPSVPTTPSEPSAPEAPVSPSQPTDPSAPEAPTTPSEPAQSASTQSSNTEDSEAAENADTSTPTNEQETGGQNDGGGTNADSTIDTGDATTNGAISNVGNANIVATGTGSSLVPTSGATVKNIGNGDSSNSFGAIGQSLSTTTDQANSATIKNNLTQNSTSGENTNNSNTGGSATINTGDANTSGSIVNLVNTNAEGVMISEFNIMDDHMGDYILDFAANCIAGCAPLDGQLENSGNGSYSDNFAGIDSEVATATFQTNTADIENNMNLVANSGDNSASRNTGADSSITTGDANVSANIANFANNNFAGNVYMGTVNIYGDLTGDIILPEGYSCSTCVTPQINAENVGNGDNTTNTANVTASDDYLLSQANTANIQNNVNIEAETGDNSTSRNTSGDNLIETGEASVLAQVVNIANNNIVGGDWWLVVVNEAGNWIGKILGAPEDTTFAASEGTDISANDAGEITVANVGNGDNSTNNAEVTQSTNTEIEQANSANIVNNVNLSANTGGNSASRNTGGINSITTGDANVILNLINFVNNNVVGEGRLFVTLVNVFGNWTGDFATPGASKTGEAAEQGQNHDNAGGSSEYPDQANNNSGSNSSSSNGASDSATSSSSSSAEVVLASSNSQVAQYSYSPQLRTSLGSSEQGGEVAFGATGNGAEDESAGTEINLAWGLLLIPAYFMLRLLRRRLAS